MNQHNLPKTYDFENTEERIYELWEEGGYFRPTNDPNEPGHDPTRKPYVISIPPPNVTGELHLGHAMVVSMEDLMIRYQRMKGIPTLWVPGSDHAGIATQLQVEKFLLRTEEMTREEIGREKFLEHTWNWKKKYGGIITNQIRRLGASCDWSRERFTLDEGLSRAVREAFVRLYEKGLIYRGPRLINWSPGLKTAVSDLEVEYSEEQGRLYYFKYMLAPETSEVFIPVATTRPETILGDTAVAVHPEDERYQQFIGKKVIVPILGREIPVIADDYVNLEFGTGALKITPGHDPNDFEIGERHGLEIISVLDESARVTARGGPYQGQDRFEARENLWADMKAAGLTIKEEEYTLQLPRSQRGGEIVEPMVSTQWFVDIKPLAEKAIAAVRDGRIKIIPEHFAKVYYNWMEPERIRDWCISRQLWWGHRIPVWYCDDCGEPTVAREDPTECAHCGSMNIQQDPDVLDTWFSSGLWPFSTLGWPDETPDLKYFYPTTMMETGYDILFFWVARMIMMGLEFTGDVPFSEVYLHGLIRDEHGRKMSKSYGNVIDPLEVIDEMGTDALRFTLLVGSAPGNDMNLSLKKVKANRNFANKIWNATRFVVTELGKLVDWEEQSTTYQSTNYQFTNLPTYTLADSWIWARLRSLRETVNRLFENYQYGEAGRQIYDFFWNEFADWYVEIAKLQMANGAASALRTAEALIRVLDTCLRMLHPFTPFVTEELWGRLKQAVLDSPLAALAKDWPEVLMIAPWPESEEIEGWEDQAIADFSLVQEIVRAIRNLRAEKEVKPGARIPAVFACGEAAAIIESQASIITALARLDTKRFSIQKSLPARPADHIALVVGPVEIYLPLTGLVDVAEERARLEKEYAEAQSQIVRLEKLLSSPFAEKAPQDVVQNERDKLTSFEETAAKLKAQIESLA
ncbi:MAG: valine--tRNA ligase [Chloroflexi bacterium]|nr:valine--tRNA ligase [Chloroflexota bacterium]